jgi:hypothetical protein
MGVDYPTHINGDSLFKLLKKELANGWILKDNKNKSSL